MPRVTITVPGKNAQPYRFQLDCQVVTLGRGSENDIAIDCGSVSVKHAEMCRVVGGYELRDLGSTNGIKLGDERHEVIPLSNGITAMLGDVAFDFELTDEEMETLAQEKPAEELPAEELPVEREPVVELKKNLPPLEPLPEEESPPYEEAAVRLPWGGSGFGSLLLFLVLAAAAFFAGLAFRFNQDTGGSLIDAIKAKNQTAGETAPAERKAPAEEEPEP